MVTDGAAVFGCGDLLPRVQLPLRQGEGELDELLLMKRGGVLNVVLHELEIVCDAATIPDEIHITLEGLEIGDSVHISQIRLPNGVMPANKDEDFTIATIVAPSAMKSEEEEAAPAGEVPTVAGGAAAGETDEESENESGER